MACCYIAASMIALIIKSCEMLDINLQIQYNESMKHGVGSDDLFDREGQQVVKEDGITMISISGMTCAACTGSVETALMKVRGVDQVLVSLPLQDARIFHESGIEPSKLITAVQDAGYGASIGERSAAQKLDVLRHTQELKTLRISLKGLVSLSTLIFCLGKGLEWLGFKSIGQRMILLNARSFILFGWTVMAATKYGMWIFRHAADAARQGCVNMHTLISLSTIVGLSLTLLNIYQHNEEAQYFDTIVGVLLIITIGRYMDLLSRRRATDTFEGLYTLLDETSSARLAKINKRVPTSILRPGDEIIIEPFRLVPCDSYILEGSTYVNEAIITGESYPKLKDVGSLMLAGSRNGSNQLKAAVHQDYSRSFLSQLITSIEVSLTSKASAQKRVDVVTQYFVSVIFAIAALASAFTFARARSAGFGVALDAAGCRLMTILAAACPCALGLATPCAVMAGIDVAWRKGILMLEGGETMEIVQKTSHVVMDKTGTLTQGTPTVTNMILNGKWKNKERELAVLICAAEERGLSSHPLAMAIFKKLLPMCEGLWSEYKSKGNTNNLQEFGGRGVLCDVNSGAGEWEHICVGNLKFLHENHVEGIEDILISSDQEGSAVFVGIDSELAAFLILQDTVRSDANTTVKALQAEAITVSMLTGDTQQEASRISQELGIILTASSATPEVKLQHIKNLQSRGHKVMMVGDGMNDGPSLAASDVGVMMAHGRKCLSSGGSVLILQSQLQALRILLDISRSTMRQVSFNIIWALSYNVIAVALAIGMGESFGLTISPPIAAAMMSISSIFITIQGLVLRMRLSNRHCPEG